MPWARTDWMSERLKFIAAYLEYEVSFSDLCRDFGISRKTGYKWVRRYETDGASALTERSRARSVIRTPSPRTRFRRSSPSCRSGCWISNGPLSVGLASSGG